MPCSWQMLPQRVAWITMRSTNVNISGVQIPKRETNVKISQVAIRRNMFEAPDEGYVVGTNFRCIAGAYSDDEVFSWNRKL